jgi:DNA-binding winged helix-turn-helix (wHTH) protein/tetratricopeptide (TPR) repeat protein
MKRKVRHTGLGGAVPVEHEVYVCGALTVDVARRQIDLAGEPVALPPKAFDLLLVFLREPGVVHTREALFERLWPGQVLLDANLTTTLSQLKRALDEPSRAKFRTVPRVGYAFDGEVERWEDESQIAPVHESPAAAVATAAVSAAIAESSPGRARFLAAGVIALLAVVAVALIWRSGAATSRPIVVIGQIATPNGDADTWIGSALRDALLRRLAAWPAVRVVDRAGSVGSALIEGARAHSPDGADFVLGAEYAVSDAGRRIAIRLILDDPRREGVEGTLARETRPEDLLASVDALLAELRDDIAPTAPQWSAVSVSIAPAAVERYSDGLRRLARHDYGAARRAFEEAVALSPEFALAELRLADVLRRLGYQALAASHYRRLAERGDALREEAGGEARARAYALAHEWPEAVSAWRRVSERFADEPRHRIGLARALIETGIEGRREAMVMLEALAAQARLAEFEIERLHALADACEADGDLARADTLLEQSLARATEAALPVLEADAALKRGWIKQQRNQREPAREHYARARELFAATGMSLGEAAAQLNGLLIDIDRPDQIAPEALEQAIRAFIARARTRCQRLARARRTDSRGSFSVRGRCRQRARAGRNGASPVYRTRGSAQRRYRTIAAGTGRTRSRAGEERTSALRSAARRVSCGNTEPLGSARRTHRCAVRARRTRCGAPARNCRDRTLPECGVSRSQRTLLLQPEQRRAHERIERGRCCARWLPRLR